MRDVERSGRIRESWLALAALAAYAIFFYRDVLFTDRVYVFRDLYNLFYSTEHVARRLAAWDWPPLWNPFPMLGKPFAADPLAGVYYPPNWLLRLLPVASGFNLSLVAHHAWATWGAYLLGRHLGMSLAAALLAGLLYGFAGPLVSCDNLYNGLLAASWGPWAILAFARWCDRPSTLSLAALSLALAMSMLGAMPEMTLFTNVVLLAVVFDRYRTRKATAMAALAAANVIAAGLCAVQLLPSAEYVGLSSRAAGLNVANALQHSLHPLGLISFVWPRRLAAGMSAASFGEVTAAEAPWLLTLYFGPVLLLAGLAAVRLRGRRRWWIGVAALFLCLSFGRHLPGYAFVIEHVAWLRFVRYPEKFLLVVHGLLAFAAGAGLDHVLAATRAPARVVVAASAVLLTAADLYRANTQLLPSTPWSEVASRPASARGMRADGDPLRIYSNGINLPAMPAYPEGFLLEKDLMLMGAAHLYDIANSNAPMTINLVDHEELERLVETVGRERAAGIVGLFNTAHVTSARALDYPGFRPLRTPSTPLEAFVYQVEPLVPRVSVPRRAHLAAGPGEALELLRHAEAPADVVVIEGVEMAVPPGDIEGDAVLSRYLPSRVEVRASMRTPGFVVLADTFYPGWHVSVDGAPAPILRANRFARALLVPAGEHAIAFEFAPVSHRRGLVVSALFALGLLAASGLELAKRRGLRTRGSGATRR